MQVQDLKGQEKFLMSELDNAQLKLVDYDSLRTHVSGHINALAEVIRSVSACTAQLLIVFGLWSTRFLCWWIQK